MGTLWRWLFGGGKGGHPMDPAEPEAAADRSRIIEMALGQTQAEIGRTIGAAQDVDRNATGLLGFDGVIATLLLRALSTDPNRKLAELVVLAGVALSGLFCIATTTLIGTGQFGSGLGGPAIADRDWVDLEEAQISVLDELGRASMRDRARYRLKATGFRLAALSLLLGGSAAALTFFIRTR